MQDDHQSIQGLASLSIARRTGLLTALIISVAIAVALVFWSQASQFPFWTWQINDKNAAEILDVLDAEGINYKVDDDTGKIMAPIDQADEIKHLLLAQGLPARNSSYEFPAKDVESGVSNNNEMMRFHKTLENEIARSIMSIQNIKTARVLLVLPEQPGSQQAFGISSASVMVNTDQGQILKKNQIKAIIHLIAASVPKLEAEQVTLIDQGGRLLSGGDSLQLSDLNARRLEYKANLEEQLLERIVDILSPIVGVESLRAQVSADLDFSENDSFREYGDSKFQDIKNKELTLGQGSTPAEQTAILSQFESAAANSAASSKSARSGLRKKPGKTIESVNDIKASLRRLSVAVVVDDQKIIQADGTVKTQPFNKNEIDRFSGLVKLAVGFDSSRGDRVEVASVAFKNQAQAQAAPERPFWRQARFYIILKQLTACLALLLLFFGIVRPLISNLLNRDDDVRDQKIAALKTSKFNEWVKEKDVRYDQSGLSGAHLDEIEQSIQAMPNDVTAILLLDTPQSYQQRLEYLKKIADADAKLVAEVIKSWIKKMAGEINQSEKASLLMLSLGMDRAANVIKYLSPREVQKLGSAMASVQNISASAIDTAVEEFISAVKSQSALVVDVDDYICRMMTTALGEDKAKSIIERILPGVLTKGIEQFNWMDTRIIADIIGKEHPQIIAIILSVLDSEQAAEVIMSLPETMHSDLLMRVARMKGVKSAALRELDQFIEKQLPSHGVRNSTPIGGTDSAANILNFIESRTSDIILGQIADQSVELAQAIQDKMFVFEDLIHLDAKDMQTLLREISTSQLLMALMDAGEGLKAKIFKSMSKRAAEILREDLATAPAVKPSEIAFARKDILNTVKKLADAGELRLGVDDN